MNTPYSLRPKHVRDDEVKFKKGIFRTAIEVTRENRAQEEISYSSDRKNHVEAALSHEHGPTTYRLNSYKKAVSAVLQKADEFFQLDRRLVDIYPDLKWHSRQTDDMYWEGQKSILVGRCDGKVVSIACLDIRFASDNISSTTKYLSIGIGPFFVPKDFRGRGHSIEMSIALSHICSVLLQALYNLLPANGTLGGSVYLDYLGGDYADEVHPFVEQVHDKLQVVHEMLSVGYLSRSANKHFTTKFLPVTLES